MGYCNKVIQYTEQGYTRALYTCLRWLTLHCLSRARATHSSCLSPTEKFSPFSTTSDSSFRGSWDTWMGIRRTKKDRVYWIKEIKNMFFKPHIYSILLRSVSVHTLLISLILTHSFMCVLSSASQMSSSQYWLKGSRLDLSGERFNSGADKWKIWCRFTWGWTSHNSYQ